MSEPLTSDTANLLQYYIILWPQLWKILWEDFMREWTKYEIIVLHSTLILLKWLWLTFTDNSMHNQRFLLQNSLVCGFLFTYLLLSALKAAWIHHCFKPTQKAYIKQRHRANATVAAVVITCKIIFHVISCLPIPSSIRKSFARIRSWSLGFFFVGNEN